MQICNVGGITGWTLPGSDTCVKFSGYITAQFTGGNLNTQYNWASTSIYTDLTGITFPISVSRSFPQLLVQASDSQLNTTFYRHETGWTTRANFGFSFASNTAWGPLIGHFDINSDMGNGFDDISSNTYLNTGYLTWAGITAGKAQSFFSFTGGGDNWANIFSPDRKGFNEPLLLAYTASFGGGFSATISAESPGAVGSSGGGTQMTGAGGAASNVGNITFGGFRWPDIVGALHYKGVWGEAQLSGVIHDVNVVDNQSHGGFDCGAGPILGFTAACNGEYQHTGWGVDAGVKFNLQNWMGGFWGAGDDIIVTGAYTQSATWYSGLPDGMWGENGQVNGNGQPMYLADAFFNPITNQWSKPDAWSVTAILEHHFTPQFYVDLEGSYGGIRWNNQGGCTWTVVNEGLCPGGVFGLGGPLSPNARSWIVGADLGWNPVTNLNFDLELMYQGTTQDTPNGVVGTIYGLGNVVPAGFPTGIFNTATGTVIPGTTTNGIFVPGAWHGNSDGFAGRFRITRYF